MTTERNKIQTFEQWTEDRDFRFEFHGSVMLVRPMNDEAQDWLVEESRAAFNAGVDWEFFGNALAIEPRFMDNIVCLLDEEGFQWS